VIFGEGDGFGVAGVGVAEDAEAGSIVPGIKSLIALAVASTSH